MVFHGFGRSPPREALFISLCIPVRPDSNVFQGHPLGLFVDIKVCVRVYVNLWELIWNPMRVYRIICECMSTSVCVCECNSFFFSTRELLVGKIKHICLGSTILMCCNTHCVGIFSLEPKNTDLQLSVRLARLTSENLRLDKSWVWILASLYFLFILYSLGTFLGQIW